MLSERDAKLLGLIPAMSAISLEVGHPITLNISSGISQRAFFCDHLRRLRSLNTKCQLFNMGAPSAEGTSGIENKTR